MIGSQSLHVRLRMEKATQMTLRDATNSIDPRLPLHSRNSRIFVFFRSVSV